MESPSHFLKKLFGPRTRAAGGYGSVGVAPLEPGAIFSHRTEAGTVELARILETMPDELGIRHVRFELFYQYRFRTMEAGERTLALPAFRRRFTRRVATEAVEPGTD